MKSWLQIVYSRVELEVEGRCVTTACRKVGMSLPHAHIQQAVIGGGLLLLSTHNNSIVS
jgi:hypothetical protein